MDFDDLFSIAKKVIFNPVNIIKDNGTMARLRIERELKKSMENPITGIFGSFISHVFKDHVEPVPGSIVLCSLAGELADHSGIYVGNGDIIELHGEGYIHKISAENFLRGSDDGNFPLRTGISIYVACSGTKPIGSNTIKQRAEKKCGQTVDYSLFSNNCHDFTSYCICGETPKGICTYEKLLTVIGKFAGIMNIDWRVWDH